MSTWQIPSQLRWMMTAMAFLLPLALALILRIILMPQGSDEDTSKPVPVCDATRFDDTSCPAGTLCVADECRTMRIDRGASGPCNNHSCRGDQECFGGVCIASDELPIATSTCRNSEPLLREILRICEQTAITSCNREDLELLTRDGSYERRIYELPNTFTVHFAAGEPKSSNRRLKRTKRVKRAEKALLDKLRARLDPLRDAQTILVLGRASAHTGYDEGNSLLAARRAELVAKLLSEALAEATTERDGGPRVIFWSLAAKSALDLRVLQQAIHAPPLAWRNAQIAELTELFAGQLHPDKIPKDRLNAISDLANQLVFIAPLPCDGTEYFPRPSLPPTVTSYLDYTL